MYTYSAVLSLTYLKTADVLLCWTWTVGNESGARVSGSGQWYFFFREICHWEYQIIMGIVKLIELIVKLFGECKKDVSCISLRYILWPRLHHVYYNTPRWLTWWKHNYPYNQYDFKLALTVKRILLVILSGSPVNQIPRSVDARVENKCSNTPMESQVYYFSLVEFS